MSHKPFTPESVSRKPVSLRPRLTKARVGALIAAGVLIVPGTALATHVFDDVPDDQFYAEPVEWAFENEITTGKTATSFAPDDPVTRGESVTFLQRYNDNVVELGQTRAEGVRVGDLVDNWNGDEVTQTATITAPTGGFLVIDYTATVTSDAGETATGTTQLTAFVDLDGDMIGQTFGGVDFDAHWQTNFNTMNVSTIVGVAAGEHTVDGTAANYGSFPAGGLLYIYDQSVNVMFVPFDGAGSGPKL